MYCDLINGDILIKGSIFPLEDDIDIKSSSAENRKSALKMINDVLEQDNELRYSPDNMLCFLSWFHFARVKTKKNPVQ